MHIVVNMYIFNIYIHIYVCLHWNCSFIGFRIVQMDVEQLAMNKLICFLFCLVSTSNWYSEKVYIWGLEFWFRLHLISLEFVSSSHKIRRQHINKIVFESWTPFFFLQSNIFWALWLLSQRRFPSPANRLASLPTNPFKSFCRRPAMKLNRWEAVLIYWMINSNRFFLPWRFHGASHGTNMLNHRFIRSFKSSQVFVEKTTQGRIKLQVFLKESNLWTSKS